MIISITILVVYHFLGATLSNILMQITSDLGDEPRPTTIEYLINGLTWPFFLIHGIFQMITDKQKECNCPNCKKDEKKSNTEK